MLLLRAVPDETLEWEKWLEAAGEAEGRWKHYNGLASLSSAWNSCAVGEALGLGDKTPDEARAVLASAKGQGEVGGRLVQAGCTFDLLVSLCKYDEAKATLQTIKALVKEYESGLV